MNLPKRCALSVTQQKLHRHHFLTSAPQCPRLAQNRIRPVTVKKTTKSSAEPHKTQNKGRKGIKWCRHQESNSGPADYKSFGNTIRTLYL